MSALIGSNDFMYIDCCRWLMIKAIRHYQRLRHERLPLLAARYHVASLGLFGSYLHGTQRPDSDLDVLVTFDEMPSLFRLIELQNYLRNQLGVKVDLVPRSALNPHIGERVLKEVVPV